MTDTNVSRRGLLKGAAALIVGMQLPLSGKVWAAGDTKFMPNAFVVISKDSTVKVLIKHAEMGQGPMTGLATLVAEELDADWAQISAEHAPANVQLYANLFFHSQGTGGSTAIANSYMQMREAGAAARALLVESASKRWNVSAEDITISNGVISHSASGKTGNFGDFVELAATLPAPKKVTLKKPADFTLIGTDKGTVKRLDSLAKSTGTATFGLDIHEDNMLTVVVAHPPLFGATVKSFDASAALKVNGVVAVKQVPTGVAVYATSSWPAIKARRLLSVKWDDSKAEKRSSETLFKEYSALAKKPGNAVRNDGNVAEALAKADTVIDKEFYFPYLAHAPMEPLNGVIYWDGKTAKTRFGSQGQTGDQMGIAMELGIKPEAVFIQTEYMGGSFGRRSQPAAEFARELAQVAREYGKGTPIKLMWTREDDIQGGFYRPLFVHCVQAGIRDGKISAWQNRLVGASFLAGTPMAAMIPSSGIDPTMVEGSEVPYQIPNVGIESHMANTGVPTLWWRSVAHTHTAYAKECVIDELIQNLGQDPIEGRIALLGDNSPRLVGVLRAVAKMADWGSYKPAKGRALGVAVAESFSSYVAEIAEVSLDSSGNPKVHKVWCAVDCGVAVNPDIVRAQMEGGIGYGLGHALYAEVTLKNGNPEQQNFDTYRSLRVNEMPEIHVHVVPSAEAPTGVGEPGVPPIAPAVANALARLGKERPTHLPMVQA